MTVGGGRIVVDAKPRPVSYRIVRGPGYYCCYCSEQQPGSQEAQGHVALHKEAQTSANPPWFRRLLGDKPVPLIPDPENPSGYRKDNFYECMRET